MIGRLHQCKCVIRETVTLTRELTEARSDDADKRNIKFNDGMRSSQHSRQRRLVADTALLKLHSFDLLGEGVVAHLVIKQI